MTNNNFQENDAGPQRADRQRTYLKSLGVAACLALTLFTGGVQAAKDSAGTDFWLLFNQNYFGSPELTLFISADAATSGTVTIPGIGFSQNFTVSPGTVASIPIPPNTEITTNDVIENKGIHVTAQKEVTVYGLNRIPATTDAFLGLPSDALDTNYIVLSYTAIGLMSELGVVATQNNTKVTITPSQTAAGHLGGLPYTITLNQGQTYQLGVPDPGSDLTGSLITSDKPIAVFGANQCTDIPLGYFACDHVVEELTPTSAWGKSFVTMPLATRHNGDTFRILASKDNTQVRVDSGVVATLNKGQFHEQIIAGPATITASQPVMVAQYSNSTTFDEVTSDPFMMLIFPFEQFLNKYTVATPTTGFPINYINVVASNADISNVKLDGTPIPAAQFQPIPRSAFSGVQLAVGPGAHVLTGVLPFGANVYGFASFDSYGYPAGGSFTPVATVSKVTLSPKTAAQNVGSQACVTATALNQFSVPVPGVRVDFTVTGVNPTQGFVFADTTGNAKFCYTGRNKGLDTITGAVGSVKDTATVQWNVPTPQYPKCDANFDHVFNLSDILALRQFVGLKVQPGDPRDFDGDGVITGYDVRGCEQLLVH